jgi:hypothetical protein
MSTGPPAWGINLEEHDMPRRGKSADSKRQERKPVAMEEGEHQKGVPRSPAEARAWATANKLHGGGKKVDSRRKVPSGPLGGSGRKTNLSRSS